MPYDLVDSEVSISLKGAFERIWSSGKLPKNAKLVRCPLDIENEIQSFMKYRGVCEGVLYGWKHSSRDFCIEEVKEKLNIEDSQLEGRLRFYWFRYSISQDPATTQKGAWDFTRNNPPGSAEPLPLIVLVFREAFPGRLRRVLCVFSPSWMFVDPREDSVDRSADCFRIGIGRSAARKLEYDSSSSEDEGQGTIPIEGTWRVGVHTWKGQLSDSAGRCREVRPEPDVYQFLPFPPATITGADEDRWRQKKQDREDIERYLFMSEHGRFPLRVNSAAHGSTREEVESNSWYEKEARKREMLAEEARSDAGGGLEDFKPEKGLRMTWSLSQRSDSELMPFFDAKNPLSAEKREGYRIAQDGVLERAVPAGWVPIVPNGYAASHLTWKR